MRETYGALDADVIAFGHLHFPHIQWLDAKLLVNVGYVAPRSDRPGRCTWTLLEYKQERWSLQHIETPYDLAEEAQLCAERGLPQP
jgi:predicted phosphodiesterase